MPDAICAKCGSRAIKQGDAVIRPWTSKFWITTAVTFTCQKCGYMEFYSKKILNQKP